MIVDGLTCDYTVYRLLALALADSIGVQAPQEFAVLHGQADDILHDESVMDDVSARHRLGGLIAAMRK